MRVLWTPDASWDLEEAVRFIAEDKPEAAVRVAQRIYTQMMKLEQTPHIGRPGALAGTRELVFAHWPYIAVYRVEQETIRILRIRHASRQWPGR